MMNSLPWFVQTLAETNAKAARLNLETLLYLVNATVHCILNDYQISEQKHHMSSMYSKGLIGHFRALLKFHGESSCSYFNGKSKLGIHGDTRYPIKHPASWAQSSCSQHG
jgi:hypothetical protein